MIVIEGKVSKMYTVAIGCDPNGLSYKERLASFLSQKGYVVIDMSGDDNIYANTAFSVANAVRQGTCDRGILICGTGIGRLLQLTRLKVFMLHFSRIAILRNGRERAMMLK